ncbi:nucleotidyl transferase AbiEii/AbiGii toxin family protein [Sinorhizobium meliloti]|uniref:nucleotidyl transferase AbiEii/AbiGii toxin family protein n=1 Tax=Rhizobium meliloti TaxID=382 RepID=UPI003CC77E12
MFKGGTSLSKAYGGIRRFSEDIDLTYDIRALAPDLVGDNDEALPKTRSAGRRHASGARTDRRGGAPATAIHVFCLPEGKPTRHACRADILGEGDGRCRFCRQGFC